MLSVVASKPAPTNRAEPETPSGDTDISSLKMTITHVVEAHKGVKLGELMQHGGIDPSAYPAPQRSAYIPRGSDIINDGVEECKFTRIEIAGEGD